MPPSRNKSPTELCRSCLVSSKNMTHMQTPVKNEATPGLHQFPEYCLTPKAMLENLLSLRIVMNDKYPSSICSMCLDTLKLAHRFKLQAEATQKRIGETDFMKPKPEVKPKPKRKRIRRAKPEVEEEKEAVLPHKVRIVKLADLFPNKNEPLSDERETCYINLTGVDEDCVINTNSEDDLNEGEILETSGNSTNEFDKSIIIQKTDEELLEDLGEGEEIRIEFHKIEETTEEEDNKQNLTVNLNEFDENPDLNIEDFGQITIVEEPNVQDDTDEGQSAEIDCMEVLVDEPAEPEIEADEILVTCTICCELIPENSVDEHMQLHEIPENPLTKSETPKEIFCMRCGNVNKDKKSFLHHLRYFHKFAKPSRVCNKCDYVGQSDSAIRHHVWTHRGKLFKCSKCPKNYNTMCQLREHMKKHYNLRNYLCNFCGKGFNYWVGLKYHLRLHAEKNFTCHFCGLKYRMEYSLKRHIRTHTKEKPYNCEYCPKSFSSCGEKKSHQLIHTGEKPYVCIYCPKAFAKSVNRTTHYMSHPGPHSCNFCSRTFVEAYLLTKHLKQRHADTSNRLQL